MIGTPTFMSPEQAEMSGLDIDTRTDFEPGLLSGAGAPPAVSPLTTLEGTARDRAEPTIDGIPGRRPISRSSLARRLEDGTPTLEE
jgi:hypothetical protein